MAGSRSSISVIVAVFAGGNLLNMVLRLAGGVLTARYAAPAVLGLFNGMGLILGYASFLQLGILNGLNRELPYYIGQDDRPRAESLAAAGQAWALLIGGAGAGVLLVLAAWYAAGGQLKLAAGWVTYAVSLFLLFYSQLYLQTTYRTGGDFARLSAINVVQNGLAFVLVGLVWLFGFYGLCLRLALMGAAGMVLLWYWRPLKVGPHWDRRHLVHLLKIGAPIFLVGQLYAWWIVLDCTLVLKFAGVKSLGLYQLSVMAGLAVETLPMAVSQILYPKMSEEYGRTRSVRRLVALSVKPVVATILCMVPIVSICWLLLPLAVNLLMPNYAEGIEASRWAVVVAATMAIAPVNNVFNVVKRQDLYLAAVIGGMVVYYGVLLLLNRGGVALVHFPQAMLAGRVFFLVTSYLAVIFLYRCGIEKE
ncbi:MAG: oligosaccharide flippase family protein [Deltaproteobacteria bacterium]|nr:oligosaccharide flippase family protein [Deltaproteobacteria bacterium]